MCPTGLRMSGGGRRELARGDRSPLHPLDGRREAPDRQRVTIRSPDGAALWRPRHLVSIRQICRISHRNVADSQHRYSIPRAMHHLFRICTLIHSNSASVLTEILQKSSDCKILTSWLKRTAPGLETSSRLFSPTSKIVEIMHNSEKTCGKQTVMKAASAFLAFLYI